MVVVEAPANAVQALPTQPHAPEGEGPSRAGAEKGKVMEPPAFTVEYGLDASSGEATITIDMHIKVTDQVLQDHRLAEELIKMVMLPTDWKMAHDITILHEVLNDFARLNSELENKAQTTDAWAEVAGELLHAAEEWEKKYHEKLAKLEAGLGITWNKSANLEEEFGWLKVDFQKEMESTESALAEERSKGAELLEKLSAMEELLVAESIVETRV
ncbi:hypothetical protein COCNU_scaffold015050G000020 [Cocos nucifera]|nr:hypothetical protein [Cocos nucifera]